MLRQGRGPSPWASQTLSTLSCPPSPLFLPTGNMLSSGSKLRNQVTLLPSSSSDRKLQSRQSSMTFPSALSSRQDFRVMLEGLSCQHLHLEISDSSIFSHLQNRPWGGGSAYFTDGETASETRKWLIQLARGRQRPTGIVFIMGLP